MRNRFGDASGGITGPIIKAAGGGTNYYGITVSSLQTGIKITDNSISGNLKFIKSYPGFSGNNSEHGNFLALTFDAPNAEKIETKISTGKDSKKWVDATDDGFCVYKVKDKAKQKIYVQVTEDGETTSAVYSLNNLTVESAPPVGEDAFDFVSKESSQFGFMMGFYDPKKINISWTGTKATVTGKLKWVVEKPPAPYKGNMFYLALNKAYYEDCYITVINGGEEQPASKNTNFVLYVSEATKQKGITFKYDDTVIAEFDFSGLTLATQPED